MNAEVALRIATCGQTARSGSMICGRSARKKTSDIGFETSDLALPGYRLHPLKGNLKDFWSISVSSATSRSRRCEAPVASFP